MGKELYPHIEVGMMLDLERHSCMEQGLGFGTNDICDSAGISTRTFRK